MQHGAKLKYAFTKVWQSPALLSVSLLEFIFTVLLGFLFYLLDMFILKSMNIEVFSAAGGDWHSLVNPTTIFVGLLLILVQGIIFVYVTSFFKAGFYGMLKNTIHDNSTVFAEFMPSAKRYWYALFRLLLFRYAILFCIASPFILSFIIYVWTTPQFVSSSLSLVLMSTFLLGILLGLLTFFLLMWSEAIIVFEDEDALNAMKQSFQLTKKYMMIPFVAFLVFLLLIVGAVVVSSIISVPFELAATRLPPAEGAKIGLMTPQWQMTNDLVDFLLNVVTIYASIVGSLFIFAVYYELTREKKVAVVHPPSKKKKKHDEN
jgi:hypothetical protein